MKQTRLRTKRYPAGRGAQRALAVAVFALALFALSRALNVGGPPAQEPARTPIAAVTATPPAVVPIAASPTVGQVPRAGFPTPAIGEAESGSLLIPAQEWHTIQLGAYSTAQAAQQQADLYTARGAAGYILEDDRFRVLAAVYATREDADIIKVRLLDSQGIDAYIYRLSAEEVELSVTAASTQIQALRDGFAAVQGAIEKMGLLSMELDKQMIDGGMVILSAQEEQAQLRMVLRALESLLGTNSSEVVTGLLALLENADGGLGAVCAQNAQESVRMTSTLKYHQLDLLWKYIQYIRRITAQQI